jgi:hypothetical protein
VLIELYDAVRLFFREQIQLAADEASESAIEPFINGHIEIKTLLDQWFRLVEVIENLSR